MSNVYTRNFPKVFPWVIKCSETEAHELLSFIFSLTTDRTYESGSSWAWTRNYEHNKEGDLWLSGATADRLVVLPQHSSVMEQDFISSLRLRIERSREAYSPND